MRDITLDHYLRAASGQVLATGLQALVRLPLEQSRLDRVHGLNTAGFISGYRGSPLGRYDMDLAAAVELTQLANIVVQPAVNEEMAATAIWGTQQVNLMPGAKHEGVFAIWYGKAPGIDRALDPLRHGNFAGSAPKGGVVLLVGDDPECKSSTLPSQSEYALVHAEIPILNPSDVQEALDFGMAAFALSRYSGCWVALMATSDTMESHAVIDVGLSRYEHLPQRKDEAPLYIRHHDTALAMEARLRGLKLPAAVEFARLAKLNRVTIDGPKRRLGIIATGRAYGDLMQALKDLGLDHAQAAELGLSVLKIDMLWPLDGARVREFAAGLEEILVVEDKRPLLEGLVKTALYDLAGDERPRVVGKQDAEGKPLLPDTAILSTADITKAILDRLPPNVVSFADAKFKLRSASGEKPRESRSPYFCSGCPHNRSARAVEGSSALAGIGCHYLVRFGPHAETNLFSQMGGEGAQWVGQAPFTTTPHMFANMGDGTYVHSGILAVRQAVAAKTRITYKFLFNGAVAMTGGQPVEGNLDVAQMTRQLAAEGVSKIGVVAEDPKRHNANEFAPGTTLYPRHELARVERAFRELDGVTAIIYDQMCATEKRRMRKRGLLADPAQRPFINELVCEGCGDCTVKSNCLSVEPLETDFGRKRRINQSSCNKDFSCLEGFCPSFVTVHGGQRRKLDVNALLAEPIPEPPRADLARPHNTLITGIGGLGVTTLAGVMAMAGHLEGLSVRTLNQPGLAQKGGGVASHIRIARRGDELATPSVPLGEADLHIAYDMILGGSASMRARTAASRTATLVNHDLHPTAGFLSDTTKAYDAAGLEQDICANSRIVETIDVSKLSEALMGTELFGNMIMLGYAVQKGWVPLSLASITRAIVLNGASANENRQALDVGRMAAAMPEKVAAFVAGFQAPLSPPPSTNLDEIIAARREYLKAYQSERYAARYEDLVAKARFAEETKVPGTHSFAEAVARGLFALMVIKDEYEVARLLTTPEFKAQLDANFTGGYTLSYHLAPSWLARTDKATGEPRKVKIGAWLAPVLEYAARLKVLRGTLLDPFTLDPLRRKERKIRDAHMKRVAEMTTKLTPANHALAVEIAALPMEMKGYGHIKARNIAKTEARLEELWQRFTSGGGAKPSAAPQATRAG